MNSTASEYSTSFRNILSTMENYKNMTADEIELAMMAKLLAKKRAEEAAQQTQRPARGAAQQTQRQPRKVDGAAAAAATAPVAPKVNPKKQHQPREAEGVAAAEKPQKAAAPKKQHEPRKAEGAAAEATPKKAYVPRQTPEQILAGTGEKPDELFEEVRNKVAASDRAIPLPKLYKDLELDLRKEGQNHFLVFKDFLNCYRETFFVSNRGSQITWVSLYKAKESAAEAHHAEEGAAEAHHAEEDDEAMEMSEEELAARVAELTSESEDENDEDVEEGEA